MSIIFLNLNHLFICLIPDAGFRILDSGFSIRPCEKHYCTCFCNLSFLTNRIAAFVSERGEFKTQ